MGGSQPAPYQPTPQEQALAQIQMDNAAAERTARAAEASRAQEEAARQRQIESRNSNVARAYSEGSNWGQQKAGSLGFADQFGILDEFNRQLSSARNAVPETASDVGSYFNYDDIWNKSMNTAETAQRSKMDNQFRELTPIGWQNNYFADTADDDILDAILGEQYGAAFDNIDAKRARGQLSDGAFSNALGQLDQKKVGARSKLEDLGLGVLEGYRTGLGDVSKQYSDGITNYKIGQNFNVGDLTGALTSKADSYKNRMRGDIYNAIGDTSFFNTDTITAKANSAAGVSNNPLRNAFRDMSLDPSRTTGTTGVF